MPTLLPRPAVVVTLLASLLLPLFLGALSCASSARPRERERRARRYDGPVLDLYAHLALTGATDEAEQYRKNAADPRLQKIAAVVTAPAGRPDETRAQNDRVLALAAENKKIVPVPSVFPTDGPAALDELNRVADAGATLVHLSPSPRGLDPADPSVAALVQRAGERGIVLFVEGNGPADPSLFARVLALAERYPATQLIVVRMGLVSFRDAAALIAAKKGPAWGDNVWLELSSTATLYAGSPAAAELVWIIRKLQKRVLFGSGFPLDTSSQAIDAVQALGLEEGEQADVLYGNAARLLHLAP